MGYMIIGTEQLLATAVKDHALWNQSWKKNKYIEKKVILSPVQDFQHRLYKKNTMNSEINMQIITQHSQIVIIIDVICLCYLFT